MNLYQMIAEKAAELGSSPDFVLHVLLATTFVLGVLNVSVPLAISRVIVKIIDRRARRYG